MAFYATCPYCKIPALLDEEYRQRACACSSCGQLFQPTDQTAIQTFSAPPTTSPKLERPAWREEAFQARPPWDQDDYADEVYADRRPRPSFPDLRGQSSGNTAVILFILLLLAEVVDLVLTALQYSLWVRWEQAGQGAGAEPANDWLDGISVGWGLLAMVLKIVLIVFYLMWVYQSYDNLRNFRVQGLSYSPAMAVVFYLIPVVSMVIPFLIMAEVWKASAPKSPDEDTRGWQQGAWHPWIIVWWICWVLADMVAGVSAMLIFRNAFDLLNANAVQDPTLMKTSLLLSTVSILLSIVAILCIIRIMRDVMARQKIKYDLLVDAESPRD